MSAFVDFYDQLLNRVDPRVVNWPLMSSLFVPVGIVVTYLFIIYKTLPTYMADKRPYNLKTIIAIYNIFQVVACAIIVYGMTTSGWTTHYTFGCELMDYSEDKLAVRMARFFWWILMLKLLEFVETVFFILRKKYNQVSFLHVYHHASSFTVTWLAVRYHAGGMISFAAILNSLVHILMYTYYFLSGLGPEMRQKLEPLKSKLTLIQIIQLCIIFVYTAQILAPSCQVNILVAYILLPVLLLNLVLFIRFYMQNYSKKKIN